MEQRIKFSDWLLTQPIYEKVAVLGAGPSMEKYLKNPQHFKNKYSLVIGCNWVYMQFPTDITITTHYIVAEHVLQHEDCPGLFMYSEKSSDAMYRDDNPHAKGVHFVVDQDLFIGNSIAITAAHLAGLLGAQVDLYGVDLKRAKSGRHYYTGYKQANDNIYPNGENFPHWCDRVRQKMNGLTKVLKVPFTFFE